MFEDKGVKYFTFDELPDVVQKAFYDNYDDANMKEILSEKIPHLDSVAFDHFDEMKLLYT